MPLPEEEILEGTPDARCLFTAESGDEGASAGFWSCEPGRYEFYFGYDEFVYLVEGELTVTQGSKSFAMKPGDTAHFPQGCTTIWHVTKKMTKYFVARAPYQTGPEEARRILEEHIALGQDDQDTELMRRYAAQLYILGQPQDVHLIWRAKQSSFDAGCSIERQLLCGPGWQQARSLLKEIPLARQALEELGDFDRQEYLQSLHDYFGDDLNPY